MAIGIIPKLIFVGHCSEQQSVKEVLSEMAPLGHYPIYSIKLQVFRPHFFRSRLHFSLLGRDIRSPLSMAFCFLPHCKLFLIVCS